MSDKKKDKDILSVANSIKGWALINIQDIFAFMITATDEEIIERYGSEKTAVDIAEKYLDIAKAVDLIEYPMIRNDNYLDRDVGRRVSCPRRSVGRR